MGETARWARRPGGQLGVQYDEVVRALVERLDPVRGDDDDVLDPGTPATRLVDARLDAEGHARLEQQVVAFDDVRLLVHVQANAVTGPMDELLTESRLADQIARRGVDRLGGHSWADSGDSCTLSLLQHA